MFVSELLGRGDGGGADADWDWEMAQEMNQSWPPQCLRDSTRADDARVPAAWIELEGAGAVIDGDDEEGSGVASGVLWWW